MNDDDLITVLREQRGKIPMDTPMEQIIGRGRAVRTRRRLPGVAVALGAAAAAAFALTAALPASHPASAHDATLAAWTVVRQPDGGIVVTINELLDPTGLQSTLAADGVPASVAFSGHQNPACKGYDVGGSQSPQQQVQILNRVASPATRALNAMVIHPAALPSGAGLQITAILQNGHPAALPSGEGLQPSASSGNGQGQQSLVAVGVSLITVSRQCTGS